MMWSNVVDMEKRVSSFIYTSFGGTLSTGTSFWELLSHFGDGIFYFLMLLPLLLLIHFYFSPFTDLQITSLRYLYTCLVVVIVTIIILKSAVKRTRPEWHKVDSRFIGPVRNDLFSFRILK